MSEETVLPAAARWHQRWRETCHWLSLPAAVWPVGERLLARYQEPGRHYHGPAHVLSLLHLLDGFVGAVRDHDAVEIAIWFHDAVYDPAAAPGENERQSAHLFHREVGDVLHESLDGATVEALILATRHTSEIPTTADESLIRDLDLSILAATPARYATYREDIRQEYAHLDGATFQHGRAALLKTFLSRKHLYHTRHFRKLWEQDARKNLVGELDAISG